ERGRQALVGEAGAEPEADDLLLGEPLDQGALRGGAGQLHAGRQQQLAPFQPRRRVHQLGGVDPAHVHAAAPLPADKLEAELADQALDRELHCPISSEASLSTGRTTASISANSSGPAISGGENCTIGSPRSSVRQINPRSYSSPERNPRSSCS